jgi:hypothetical protein
MYLSEGYTLSACENRKENRGSLHYAVFGLVNPISNGTVEQAAEKCDSATCEAVPFVYLPSGIGDAWAITGELVSN